MRKLIYLLFLPLMANAQIVSVTSNSWNVGSTWSTGVVPTAADDVVINHSVFVNGSAIAKSIKVQNTATSMGRLEIKTGGVLNVAGDVDVTNTLNNTDCELYLNGNGQMVIGGSLTITRNQNSVANVRLWMIASAKLVVQQNLSYSYNDALTTGETNNEASIGKGATTDACVIEVAGNFNLTMESLSYNNATFAVGNNSIMKVQGNVNFFNKSAHAFNTGGRNELRLEKSAALAVAGDIVMNFTDLAPNGTQSNRLILWENAALTVNNIFMNSSVTSGHVNNYIVSEKNGSIAAATTTLVKGDISFSSATSGTLENAISSIDDSIIELKGKIISPGSGSIGFASQALLKLTGDGAQNLPNSTFRKLEINNNSGVKISVSAPITVAVNLNLINGIIETTSSNTLTFENMATTNAGSPLSFISGPVKRKCDASTPDMTLPIGKGANWAPIKLSGITGANSANIFSIEYFNNAHAVIVVDHTSISSISSKEYWGVALAGTKPTAATLTFYWKDACFSLLNDVSTSSALTIANFNTASGQWSRLLSSIEAGSQSCVSATPSQEQGAVSTTLTSTSIYEAFTFGSGTGTLPITLEKFSGVLSADGVMLRWTTSFEKDNDRFEIERSSDGLTFVKVATVYSKGNSSEWQHYQFVDDFPDFGKNYYRLRQVDIDGTSTISNFIFLNVTDQNRVLEIYPNPVKDNVVTVVLPATGQLRSDDSILLTIVDVTGHQFYTQRFHALQNSRTLTIPIDDFSNGAYFLTVRTAKFRTEQKLMISR